MAVKAIGHILGFDVGSPEEGININLRVYSVDPANNNPSVWTTFIGMRVDDAASVINAKLAEFIRAYCTEHFETVFDVGDTVRILAAVDSIL